MPIGALIIGTALAFIGFCTALISGLGLIGAFAVYALAGSLGTLAAALFTGTPRRRRPQPQLAAMTSPA